MRELDAGVLPDIARGAAILGCGGGGDPHIGMLLATRAIELNGPATLVSVDEVPADAVVVPVAMMGAPTVSTEKLPQGGEAVAALRALERTTGRRATHLVPIEIGGMNSLVPVAAAVETGLPLVDGDGMGRAFPEAQMTLPSLAGVSATPMAITDDKGNTTLVETGSNRWAERIARAVCTESGCSVFTADTLLAGHQLADGLVSGTVTLAQRLGAAVRSAREDHADPVAAAVDVLGGVHLATGKITDVRRATSRGFARGTATVESIGRTDVGALVLSMQNEFLLARGEGGAVLASTPDLICVLETDTGEPITTEALRYGHRVTVVAAPCDPRWTTSGGLDLVGPAAFGYHHAYSSVRVNAS
ncbi:DUF917 domain-containing protein [Amycolatopsis suaedae]|uniref:DUF917 domain-containing protein n=1 Tax=Amycolatopsis suaedae TaxID=2510978 RepID=A0A4Q7IYM6_9PSEU|nr:DUF917 domain-containing protein [Amycolatopsis suaedae]RZQ60101.1 DUF917 domain-containing protein [Amycolatopsis suaedae]